MKTLQDFKDDLAQSIYGMSTKEAKEQEICIQCHKPALENCYSQAGINEYRISGLCEKCFDSICGEE